MIPRYDRPEISRIWSEENKFQTYLKVELAIIQAQEGASIPHGTAKKIEQTVGIHPARIDEIERTVHHDVIAFCSSITEQLPQEVGKYFHFGVTSSDIIDTALNLQIKESLQLIISALQRVCSTLSLRAQEHKWTLTMGRSHGMFAEPLSFGQKLLGHLAEFQRRLHDLQLFMLNECTAQFSGAVGNYTILTPQIEQQAAQLLGLSVETHSTQVIPRDHIAKLVSIDALLACAIERLSTEIRHLHRSEVAEVHEGFQKGQKGSSTMPHKKNPISGENLTGLSRVLKSHLLIALENTVLWHERDISHSGAERLYLPDHFGLLFYALERLDKTMQDLVIHQDTMEERVLKDFSYLSSYLLHYLLQHTPYSREKIYAWVQNAAFNTPKQGGANSFVQNVRALAQQEGVDLSMLEAFNSEDLKKIYLRHIEEIYTRVAKTHPHPQL